MNDSGIRFEYEAEYEALSGQVHFLRAAIHAIEAESHETVSVHDYAPDGRPDDLVGTIFIPAERGTRLVLQTMVVDALVKVLHSFSAMVHEPVPIERGIGEGPAAGRSN